MAAQQLGILWPAGSFSGWGVYGLQILYELLRKGDIAPLPFHNLDAVAPPPLLADLVESVRGNYRAVAQTLATHPEAAVTFRFPILHALGNKLVPSALAARVHGSPDYGLVFLEDTAIDEATRTRGRRFRRLVAGSTWNAQVLAAAGFNDVPVSIQGIDPTIFHPAPRTGLLGNRFVVFSGGKFEYRKGQDLVVAAFRRFRQRHPEALLAAAWFNPWPELVATMAASPWIEGLPAVEGKVVHLSQWLIANGLPRESFVVLNGVPNALMGQVMREADVALFPNRCEGGTNLVAMECLAAGIPTILSANTGHLDLIAAAPCLTLERQGPVGAKECGTQGWGESDLDEMVEALESAYQQREAVQATGMRAAQVMRERFTWSTRIDAMLRALSLRD